MAFCNIVWVLRIANPNYMIEMDKSMDVRTYAWN